MIAVHPITGLVGPGDLVFDIGAHAGHKAAWFVSKGARVICVEPQPKMADVMRQRFAGTPAVTVIQKGVGRERTIKNMSICSKTPVISTFDDRWKQGRFVNYVWDQTAPVEITTLDALISEYGVPKYCKIDVEGYETEVLRGLTKRVGCLSFEFTSEIIDDAMFCMDHLKSIGYTGFNFSIAENAAFELPAFVSRDAVAECLLQRVKSTNDLWGDVYAG